MFPRLLIPCIVVISVVQPCDGGSTWREHFIAKSIPNLLRLQNEDGSWGDFANCPPDTVQSLRVETTALITLVALAYSDDRESTRSLPAVAKSREFLRKSCQSLAQQEPMTAAEQRVFALALWTLLESQVGLKLDDRQQAELARHEHRIDDLLQAHISSKKPTPVDAWHCLVLASASRRGSSFAQVALEVAGLQVQESSELYRGEQSWQFIIRLLVKASFTNREGLIREMRSAQARDNRDKDFEDTLFLSLAIDHIAGFRELREPNTSHTRRPLLRIGAEDGVPLLDRPAWLSWHSAILENVQTRSMSFLSVDRTRDAQRGITGAWCELRAEARNCLLCELYYRRLLVNLPAED